MPFYHCEICGKEGMDVTIAMSRFSNLCLEHCIAWNSFGSNHVLFIQYGENESILKAGENSFCSTNPWTREGLKEAVHNAYLSRISITNLFNTWVSQQKAEIEKQKERD